MTAATSRFAASREAGWFSTRRAAARGGRPRPRRCGTASRTCCAISFPTSPRCERSEAQAARRMGLMRVLAIDTALEACAAGVFDLEGRDTLASESRPMGRGHAEALMPLIARVMDAAAIDFAELDRIAVTVAPATFT